jgi:death-on-curing family protein
MYCMPRRPVTVRQLATEFALDLDTCLVTLWDAGFEKINDVDDRIASRELPEAHKALGVATHRQIRTLAFWEKNLGLKPDELRSKLAELGISVSEGVRVLPKGALAKLRKADPPGLNIPAIARSASSGRGGDGFEVNESIPRETPFEWHNVGPIRSCRYLSVEEVTQIHEALEQEFATGADPIMPPGVRDRTLLESAVYRAQTSLGEEMKYPTSPMVAAAYLHSLIHNHPFHNGNKRTALVAMLASLDRNGILLTCGEQDLFRYVLRVAQHRLVSDTWSRLPDRELIAIAEWINSASRILKKGEKPIKWRELRRNLNRLGCTLDPPQSGNRIKIRRFVTEKGIFGRSKRRELVVTAGYAGEGREVSGEYLHDIRHRLGLDDDSGCDSGHFYGTDPREPDEFISQYRTILRRLAKLLCKVTYP